MRLQFVLLGITTFVDLISADPRMLVTTIHDPRYAVLEEAPAGEGLGTVIRLVQRLSDSQILAAKFFDPSDEFQDNILRREFMFGHMFSHENIGRSIEIVEGSPTACIIMEYFPTVMLDILFTKELSTAHIDILFKQILAGVAHMHSLGIAHRDLKMDNVLLDENGNAKIIDFGRASIARDLISGDVELAYGKSIYSYSQDSLKN
jgi:serine/threonine protein kinase